MFITRNNAPKIKIKDPYSISSMYLAQPKYHSGHSLNNKCYIPEHLKEKGKALFILSTTEVKFYKYNFFHFTLPHLGQMRI